MASCRLRILSAQCNPIVGDIGGNLDKARKVLLLAQEHEVDLVLFPELFICGYPPEDLILSPAFVEACMQAVARLVTENRHEEGEKRKPGFVMGAPYQKDGAIFNAVWVVEGGQVLARRFKVHLPNYDVFDEARIFMPGPLPGPVFFRGVFLGLPICEDIWADKVIACLAQQGVDLLLVANGSPYERHKARWRLEIAKHCVQQSKCPLIYVNQVGGQDELVFDGGSFALNAEAELIFQAPFFEPAHSILTYEKSGEGIQIFPEKILETVFWRNILCRKMEQQEQRQRKPVTGVCLSSFPIATELEFCWRACVLGLRDYVEKNNFREVVLGLSGGIDSALCACLAVDALGAKRVHGVLLPSPYTTAETMADARHCAQLLGIALDVVSISELMQEVEKSLAPFFKGLPSDVTEENIQARLRGLLLMALSNKFGWMLLTTGNKSELSVGYSTLYGDMNGGFNPLKDLYKTEVYALAIWRNEVPSLSGMQGPVGSCIPQHILTKAPSAELRPNQYDQESLPEYAILDAILYSLIEEEKSFSEIVAQGHSPELIRKIEHLLHTAEYKRRQAAPGIKLSQRPFGRGRRYPITNRFRRSTTPLL